MTESNRNRERRDRREEERRGGERGGRGPDTGMTKRNWNEQSHNGFFGTKVTEPRINCI